MTESTGHLDLELTFWLDGELDTAARERVESHLRDCPACTALLAELGAVVASARSLEDRAPDSDLWPGIARRIGVAGAGVEPGVLPLRQPMARARAIARRFSFSLPQLAAAALVVALLSGGAAWWAMRALMPARGGAAVAGATGGGRDGTAAGGVEASTADFEIRKYDDAVTILQQVLKENRNRLDPETVRTVEANLATIDLAITQARNALIADPANPYLSGHLAEQMKRKIRVLQRTADAVTADYSGGS